MDGLNKQHDTQTLLNCVPLIRVKCEHFGQEIVRLRLESWKEFLPSLLCPFRQSFDILESIVTSNVL